VVDISTLPPVNAPSTLHPARSVFASIGWGGLAIVAGALITRTGVRWGILVYICMCVPNVFAAWLLNPGPRKPAAALPPSVIDIQKIAAKEEEMLELEEVKLRDKKRKAKLVALADKAAAAEETERGPSPLSRHPPAVQFAADSAGGSPGGAAASTTAAAAAATATSSPTRNQQPHSSSSSSHPHAHASSARHGPSPLSSHHDHGSSGDLRTRLLASCVHHSRTPSNVSVDSAAAAPASFLIRAYHPPGAPTHLAISAPGSTCPSLHEMEGEPSEAGSGCSTPRSTAALLDQSQDSSPEGDARSVAGPAVARALVRFQQQQEEEVAATTTTTTTAAAAAAAAAIAVHPLASFEQRGDSARDLPQLEAASAPAASAPAAADPVGAAVAPQQPPAVVSSLAALLSPAPCPCDGCVAENDSSSSAAVPATNLVMLSLAGDVGRTLIAHELRCFDSFSSEAAADAPVEAAAPSAAAAAVVSSAAVTFESAAEAAGILPPSAISPCTGLVAGSSKGAEKLPLEPPAAAPQQPQPSQQEQAGGIGYLLRQPRVLVFLMRALIIGFGIGTQVSFAFLLVREMGGTELLMGVMLLVS